MRGRERGVGVTYIVGVRMPRGRMLQREWEEEAMWEEEDAWEEERYSGGYFGMGHSPAGGQGTRGVTEGEGEGEGEEEEASRAAAAVKPEVVLSPPRACAWGSPAGGGLTLADQLAGRSIPSSPAEGEGLAALEAAMAAMGRGGDDAGGKARGEAEAEAEARALEEAGCKVYSGADASEEEDAHTCPICREDVNFGRFARIPRCGHVFCASCILSWASYKPDACCCPVCRVGFSRLVTHRHLDGEFSDIGVAESVALLLRAQWFELPAECSAGISGKRRAHEQTWGLPADAGAFVYEWDEEDDPLYWPTDDMYAEEERDLAPVSIGGGGNVRSRLLSNRPFGASGYMSMGRQLARPAPRRRGAGKKSPAVDRRASARTGAVADTGASGSGGGGP